MKLTTTDSNNLKIAISNEAILELNLSLKETILTFIREIGFELYSIDGTTSIYKNHQMDDITIHIEYIAENELNTKLLLDILQICSIKYINNTADIHLNGLLNLSGWDLEKTFNFTLKTIREIWTKNKK